jgi:Fungal Zn(2)-Cys(6) binuclear cluster domain
METSQDSRLRSEEVEDGAPKPSSSSGSAASRVRRRNRMITSCLECRRRKLKCDRLHPCTNCSKGNRECLFLASSLDSATRLKLAELKERMGTLERSLEVEVTQPTQPAEGEAPVDPHAIPTEEDELILQTSGLTVMDAVYDDEVDDVMVDLGIQVGKMRVTERLGGLVRPRLADEIAAKIKLEMQDLPGHEIPQDDGDGEVLRLLELANQGVALPFLQPSPTFIAPRSDMLLGPNLQEYALLNLLPTKAAADKLLQQYWEACHPITRIMHRPTFETRYQLLWDNIAQGIEPAPSIQAIVFATLFTAAVSMAPSDTLNIFGVDQRTLIESFQLGTESALGKAHFLRSTKTETLQAFVMYLVSGYSPFAFSLFCLLLIALTWSDSDVSGFDI